MLNRLLEAGLNSGEPVKLSLPSEADRRVSFVFDRALGFTEWQPLAFVGGQARVSFESGYLVEMAR